MPRLLVAIRRCGRFKRGRARTAQLTSAPTSIRPTSARARAGVALRVRRDGRRWVQTVKGPASRVSGRRLARARRIRVAGAAGPQLDPLRFATTPFGGSSARRSNGGLAPRFTTDFTRTTIPLAFRRQHDGAAVHRRRRGARRRRRAALRAPIYEIEIELEAGDAARLFELAQALAADLPLALEPRARPSAATRCASPRRRPRRCARRMPSSPRDAHRRRGASPRSCATACARSKATREACVADDDPEWIHQMRIGVRRLRACLALARARRCADARSSRCARKLRWLAHALGPARDSMCSRSKRCRRSRRRGARGSDAALAAGAARARARAAPAARKRATRARGRRVAALRAARAGRGALGRRAGARRRRAAHADALAAAPRATSRAPLLKRRHRALLALGTDLAHAAPEARHAARLAAKKLRYATEFFAPLFPSKRTRAYRKALAALQEELGAWNDAAVAARARRRARRADVARPRRRSRLGRGAQARARSAALDGRWTPFAAPRRSGRATRLSEGARMLESAEIGHRIAKAVYEREEPKLREALLNAQYDLAQAGRGPVLC